MPNIESYWNVTNPVFMNYLPKKISKNYYKLLSVALYIPEEESVDEDEEEEKEKNVSQPEAYGNL